MAYTSAEARQELVDALAEAIDRIGVALAALGAAYEQLDEHNADRLEAELFGPVQRAFGRAKSTYSQFADRHGLTSRAFGATSPGIPSTGAKGFIDNAVDAVAEADQALSELQDSMLPAEVGDPELRAVLARRCASCSAGCGSEPATSSEPWGASARGGAARHLRLGSLRDAGRFNRGVDLPDASCLWPGAGGRGRRQALPRQEGHDRRHEGRRPHQRDEAPRRDHGARRRRPHRRARQAGHHLRRRRRRRPDRRPRLRHRRRRRRERSPPRPRRAARQARGRRRARPHLRRRRAGPDHRRRRSGPAERRDLAGHDLRRPGEGRDARRDRVRRARRRRLGRRDAREQRERHGELRDAQEKRST